MKNKLANASFFLLIIRFTCYNYIDNKGVFIVFASLGLTVSGLIFSILIAIVYFSKRKYNDLGDKIYKVMLILTIVMFLTEICFVFSVDYFKYIPIVTRILSSTYVLLCIIWFSMLILYTWSLGRDIKQGDESLKKMIWFITFIIVSAFTIFLLLPTTYTSGKNNEFYVIGGKSIMVLYVVAGISLAFIFYSLIKNRKKVSLIKRLPIFLLLFFIIITTIVQILYADINDLTFLLAGFMAIMYFTFENQELKLVDELRNAKDEAQKASDAQTEFLSSMSHEIRTPMNSIMGFSEALLKDDNVDKETFKKDLQSIYEASNSLLTVINNILDVSRLESGKEIIENQKYNIKDILQTVVDESTKNLNPDVKFVTIVDSNTPKKIIGDSNKISKILTHILSNSVSNTENGKITLEVESDIKENKVTLVFTITDTGRGIKQEDYDKLFEKFTKLSEKNEKDGTGLGLVITKKLIDLMGGKLEFDSKIGLGTTFKVTLEQEISDATAIGNVEIIPANNELNYFDGSKYKVLVVDDSELNLRVMQKLLSPYKLKIKTLTTGASCIEELKKKKYDLIFLDHLMPGIDGIQVLRVLKKSSKTPPVIALTANLSYNASKLYIDKGFSDYLAKPIDIRELNTLLKKYLLDTNKKEGDE